MPRRLTSSVPGPGRELMQSRLGSRGTVGITNPPTSLTYSANCHDALNIQYGVPPLNQERDADLTWEGAPGSMKSPMEDVSATPNLRVCTLNVCYPGRGR